VVGRTIFTSLEPGRELYDADPAGTILNRLESMTLLFEKQAIGGEFKNKRGGGNAAPP
jgi:hypothetical protein